jgi:hypothetical protein
LVGDDPGADIENSRSSSWSEFDGSVIAQAGGAGGTGHVPATGTTTSRDAQPASRVSSSAAQSFIFSETIGLLLLGFLIEGGKRLLGRLLFFERLPGLRSSSVGDQSEVRLTTRLIGGNNLAIAVGLPRPGAGGSDQQRRYIRKDAHPDRSHASTFSAVA